MKFILALILCLVAGSARPAVSIIRPQFGTINAVAAAAANSYDYLIPNLITASSTTAGQSFYQTSTFTATNGALLLAFMNVSYASGPSAPTNVVWNNHTWIRIGSTNHNTKGTPTMNASLWRTLCTNTSSGVLAFTNFPGSPTGAGWAVFQVLNADDTEQFGSNAVIQVVATAADATATPNVSYTQPAKSGTNMLILFQGDSVNAATGRTPNSSNQWQMISQALNYGTPASGGGVAFAEAAPAGPSAVTNYLNSSRNSGSILVEVQPKFFVGGTNYASALWHGAGTNVVGTVLTRASSSNALAGKYELVDFFHSKNVANCETATNWFYKTLVNSMAIPVRVGNYGSSNTIRLTSDLAQGMGLRTSNEFTYATIGRASPANQVILKTEGDVYLGPTNNAALGQVLYDLDRSDGNVTGDFVVFQLDSGTFASGQSNRVNIETNPGGVTTHSTYIAVQTNAFVHYLKQDNRLTGICRTTVWDVRNGVRTLLGDVTSTQSHIGTFAEGSRDTDISPVKVGNAESGNSGVGELIFENFMVDDDTGRYSTNIFNLSAGP